MRSVDLASGFLDHLDPQDRLDLRMKLDRYLVWPERLDRLGELDLPPVDRQPEFGERMLDVLGRHRPVHAILFADRPFELGTGRLEFLGDAVLDFLVGAWLYDHFPEMKEGELTRLRSALVRTEQLAEFARQVDLGRAMRLGRGEDDGGGRERLALLCGTFEALVGAIFLSDGIAAVQQFIEPMLHSAVDQIIAAREEQDPKSLLQEWIQAQGFDHPLYRTVNADGPDHAKIFEVEVVVNGEVKGRGLGQSKHAAAKSAAHQALISLGLSKNDAP